MVYAGIAQGSSFYQFLYASSMKLRPMDAGMEDGNLEVYTVCMRFTVFMNLPCIAGPYTMNLSGVLLVNCMHYLRSCLKGDFFEVLLYFVHCFIVFQFCLSAEIKPIFIKTSGPNISCLLNTTVELLKFITQ